MIFSSLEFLLLFLPITFILYFVTCKFSNKIAQLSIVVLLIASLFYYAYWKPIYVLVIILSMCWNYFIGNTIHFNRNIRQRGGKAFFLLGIAVNIGVLVYYKYTGFLVTNFIALTNAPISIPNIIMPIGVSFFTFQQIAYLADIYNGSHIPAKKSFINYCLFTSFFPQLIAGPIVHHKEMMPQFANAENRKLNYENIYWGLVLLSIGLTKKLYVSDSLSPLVINAFENVADLSFIEAGFSTIAYTLQLYFDFSGYSDMAVGCGLLFNIKLPFNFNSPYKATNIQDFWNRWHITLSRWLREYIYIPLGGNRKGQNKTYINLFLTFLIGGIWHGAAWTFILWGILHGIGTVLHRLWKKTNIIIPRILSTIITFGFICITWIPFRAPNFERVKLFFDGLLLKNGFWYREEFLDTVSKTDIAVVGIALIVIFLLRNSKELYEKHKPSKKLTALCIVLFIACLWHLLDLFVNQPGATGEFIYFQF